MAVVITEQAHGVHDCYYAGTASGNSDASPSMNLPTPCRTFSVTGARPDSGNFTFTLQGSLDDVTYYTLATCTVTGGLSAYISAVDKPARFIKVVFTDVATATVSFRVCGVR